MRKSLVLAATLALLAAGCGEDVGIPAGPTGRGTVQPSNRAPKSTDEIRRILDEDASKPRFDGVVHGWRLAPDQVLEAEGVRDRNLSVDCEPKLARASMTIDLDFSFTYLPEASDLEAGEPRERYAWVCGGRGLSVRYSVPFDTPYGGGELTAERAVWGRRALSLHAADDRVEAGTVKGHPAILVHYADDKAGLGLAHIIVLEDDVGPEFTILRMSADNGISWPEFMKIAEGVA